MEGSSSSVFSIDGRRSGTSSRLGAFEACLVGIVGGAVLVWLLVLALVLVWLLGGGVAAATTGRGRLVSRLAVAVALRDDDDDDDVFLRDDLTTRGLSLSPRDDDMVI